MKVYGRKYIYQLVGKYGSYVDKPIELIPKYSTLEKRLEKRLEDVLDFITYLNSDEPDETKDEQDETGDEEDVILNKNDKFTMYDVIFLSVLISLYTHPVFKKIRGSINLKVITPKDEEQWVNDFRKELRGYKKVWEEYLAEESKNTNERIVKPQKTNTPGMHTANIKRQINNDRMSWETVSFNIESYLYRLIMLNYNENTAEERKELREIKNIFDGLPDHLQKDFYDKTMKNRVTFISDNLKKYITDLETEDPIEYGFYIEHRKLLDLDKSIDTDLSTQDDLKKYLDKL